jgi:hypothetical protein
MVSKKGSLKEISVPSPKLKTCEMFLRELADPRRGIILQFHAIHRTEIEASWGSKSKHQAWPGGYVDHLAEIFRMAEVMYDSLSQLHPLPFSRDSAVIVHGTGTKTVALTPHGFDKLGGEAVS